MEKIYKDLITVGNDTGIIFFNRTIDDLRVNIDTVPYNCGPAKHYYYLYNKYFDFFKSIANLDIELLLSDEVIEELRYRNMVVCVTQKKVIIGFIDENH